MAEVQQQADTAIEEPKTGLSYVSEGERTEEAETPAEDLNDEQDEGADEGNQEQDNEGEETREKPEEAAKTDTEKPAEVAPVVVAPKETPKPTEQPKPVDHLSEIGITPDNTLGRKLVEALTKGGLDEVQKFLKVYGTDWDKVSHLDVIRSKVESKYAGITDTRKRQLLVNRDMAKYDTSSFDDDARELSEAESEFEANAIRDEYKAQQSSYTVPGPAASVSVEETERKAQEAKMQADFEATVYADPYLATFETNRQIELGKGDTAFKYAVPDMDLRATLANPLEPFFTREEGKLPRLDVKGLAEALSFYKHKDDILAKLAEHYMQQGEKRKDAKLRNMGKEKPVAPSEQTTGYKYMGAG